MAQPIYGRITNYRIGIRTQTAHECLVEFQDALAVAKANRLVGRKVVWQGKNVKHTGKIIDFHGRNGVVRVRFKKSIPGQGIGTIVQLVS
jgi:ribosomal protein L35AE/L33A